MRYINKFSSEEVPQMSEDSIFAFGRPPVSPHPHAPARSRPLSLPAMRTTVPLSFITSAHPYIWLSSLCPFHIAPQVSSLTYGVHTISRLFNQSVCLYVAVMYPSYYFSIQFVPYLLLLFINVFASSQSSGYGK